MADAERVHAMQRSVGPVERAAAARMRAARCLASAERHLHAARATGRLFHLGVSATQLRLSELHIWSAETQGRSAVLLSTVTSVTTVTRPPTPSYPGRPPASGTDRDGDDGSRRAAAGGDPEDGDRTLRVTDGPGEQD